MLVQVQEHNHGQLPGGLPAPREPHIVQCVGVARAALREPPGLLLVAPRGGQYVQPEALLRREPVVELAEPPASHPAFLPLSTLSRASSLSSSSPSSFHFLSSSSALSLTFRTCETTAASARASSPDNTRSARAWSWSLTPLSSASGLLLAALEAALLRAPSRAGSWAGQ